MEEYFTDEYFPPCWLANLLTESQLREKFSFNWLMAFDFETCCQRLEDLACNEAEDKMKRTRFASFILKGFTKLYYEYTNQLKASIDGTLGRLQQRLKQSKRLQEEDLDQESAFDWSMYEVPDIEIRFPARSMMKDPNLLWEDINRQVENEEQNQFIDDDFEYNSNPEHIFSILKTCQEVSSRSREFEVLNERQPERIPEDQFLFQPPIETAAGIPEPTSAPGTPTKRQSKIIQDDTPTKRRRLLIGDVTRSPQAIRRVEKIVEATDISHLDVRDQTVPEIQAEPEIQTETEIQVQPEIQAGQEIQAPPKVPAEPEMQPPPEVLAEPEMQPPPEVQAEPEIEVQPGPLDQANEMTLEEFDPEIRVETPRRRRRPIIDNEQQLPAKFLDNYRLRVRAYRRKSPRDEWLSEIRYKRTPARELLERGPGLSRICTSIFNRFKPSPWNPVLLHLFRNEFDTDIPIQQVPREAATPDQIRQARTSEIDQDITNVASPTRRSSMRHVSVEKEPEFHPLHGDAPESEHSLEPAHLEVQPPEISTEMSQHSISSGEMREEGSSEQSQAKMTENIVMEMVINRLAHDVENVLTFRELFPPSNYNRQAVTSAFISLLELHKKKKVTLSQDEQFGPLYIRNRLSDE